MVVKIRLARFGRRHAPVYNIVVAQARYTPFSALLERRALLMISNRSARNGKPIEVLGTLQYICSQLLGIYDWEANEIGRLAGTSKRDWQRELIDDSLGTYDPIPQPPTDGEGKPFKDIKLDSARAKYWLGVGAQPSDPAWRLLSMVSAVFQEEKTRC